MYIHIHIIHMFWYTEASGWQETEPTPEHLDQRLTHGNNKALESAVKFTRFTMIYHQMYVFYLKRVPFFPARLEDLSKKMRSQCH